MWMRGGRWLGGWIDGSKGREEDARMWVDDHGLIDCIINRLFISLFIWKREKRKYLRGRAAA